MPKKDYPSWILKHLGSMHMKTEKQDFLLGKIKESCISAETTKAGFFPFKQI